MLSFGSKVSDTSGSSRSSAKGNITIFRAVPRCLSITKSRRVHIKGVAFGSLRTFLKDEIRNRQQHAYNSEYIPCALSLRPGQL